MATESKAQFVRSLPPDMPAKDVVAKAKAKGLKLSPAYVYVIRSKGGGKGGAKKVWKGKGTIGKPSTEAGHRNVERQFVSIAVDLGFARAQQLLDETRSAIRRAVG